jgi:hypothetical protein
MNGTADRKPEKAETGMTAVAATSVDKKPPDTLPSASAMRGTLGRRH